MTSPGDTTAHRAALGRARWAGLFLFVFAYLYLRVDPELLFFGHGAVIKLPIFSEHDALALGVSRRPGGAGEFVAAYLMRYLGRAWVGPAILTLLAALLCLSANRLATSASGERAGYVGCVPVFLLLVLVGRYGRPILCMSYLLPMVLALGLAAVYTLLPPRAPARCLALLLFSATVYLFGAGAVLLFGIVCAVCEILGRRRPSLGIVALALAGVVPCIAGRFVFHASTAESFLRLTPLDPSAEMDTRMLHCLLYLSVPLGLIVVWRLRARRDAPDRRASASGSVWAAGLLVLFAAAVLGMTLDRQARSRLRLNYFARMGRWAEVLEEVRHLRRPDDAARLDVTCALYHTGRLADDMFAFPYGLLDLAPAWSWREMSLYADIYLDMGHTNAAEAFGLANLVLGDHPLVLRQLGRTYLVKGQPDSAWVFFNALRCDASCGHWADEYLAALRRGDPDSHEDCRRLRSLAIREHGGFTEYPPMQMMNLPALLEANPQNRMAFEFTMASLLVKRRLDEFVRELPKAKAAGCRGRLRLYQEAFLLHAGDAEATTAAIDIEPETRRRFREFEKACASAQTEADHAHIADRFGDSYFFYHRFGRRAAP